MRRWIAQRLIDRVVDSGESPPRWVQERLQRDPWLQQYERVARSTVSRLRRDAESWISANPPLHQPLHELTAKGADRKKFRGLPVLLTAAAVLLIAVSGFRWFDQTDSALNIPDDSPSTAGMAKADPLEDDLRSIALLMRRTSKPQIAALMLEPAEAAGRLVGRGLTILDQSLEQERDRIAIDARSTVTSFATELQNFGLRRGRSSQDAEQ
jgi:hypothetical protein